MKLGDFCRGFAAALGLVVLCGATIVGTVPFNTDFSIGSDGTVSVGAFTGDVSKSSGSLATTVTKVNGNTPGGTCGANQVATSVDSSGRPTCSALPNPSATTLGGVESLAVISHQFLTGISTSGVPSQAQPSSADLSDETAPVAFTPVLNFGAATTGITYISRAGQCTRIGKQATCEFSIVLSSKGSATGAATVTGFTWSAANTAGLVIPYAAGMTLSGAPMGYMQVSSTLNLGQSSATGFAALTDAAFGNSTNFYGSISFITQ